MARKKIDEVFDDVQTEFDSVILKTNLESLINIKLQGDETQKKEVIKVKRVDDYNYSIHGFDVIISINQGIFEQLPPEQKVFAIEAAIASISYSFDKDSVVASPVDVKVHSGVLSKHSYDSYLVLQESIRTLYAKKKNEEK